MAALDNPPKSQDDMVDPPPNKFAEIMPQLDVDAQKEICEGFTLFDSDISGTINSQDMALVIRQLGYNPTEAQLKAWAEKYGDQDQKITLEGFFHILKENAHAGNNTEELELALKRFDPSNSGYIQMRDMKNLLTKRGEAISEADFDEIMEALNIGIDGKIKHQDLLKRVSNK